MDISSQLLEFSFRGVKCPITSFIDHFTQDMPEHKFTDVNGSRSEGTGRNAYTFTVKMLFVDGLARGINETWDNLYPQTYNDMLVALEDRSTGPLQHPERGIITCKVVDVSSDLSAEMRGGRIVSVVFRETDDETNILNPVDSNILTSGALVLSNTLGSLNPPPPDPGPSGQSFSDFCNSIASIGDTATLVTMQITGKIDTVVSNLNKISDSFSRGATAVQTFPFTIANNTTSFSNADTIQVQANLGNGGAIINQQIALMITNLLSIKNKILGQNKSTGFYVTQFPMTMAKLAQILKNDVQSLYMLNPSLNGYRIPQKTRIEYYL